MPNNVYLGPAGRSPITVSSKTLAASYLPCTFVTEGASTLTQATAAGGNLLILGTPLNQAGHFTSTDTLKTAITSGDVALAYEPVTGEEYQVAFAAATYTFGQELTVAASGRMAAATTGQVVVAVTRFAGTLSAGDLGKVKIVNYYAKA